MLWSNGWGMHSFRCTVGKCMLRKSSIFFMSTVSYLPILVQSFSIIMITLMVVTRTLIKLIACGIHWEWTICTTSTWFTHFSSTKTHWKSQNPKIPIGSMYGIFTSIWLKCMIYKCREIYQSHGSSGIVWPVFSLLKNYLPKALGWRVSWFSMFQTLGEPGGFGSWRTWTNNHSNEKRATSCCLGVYKGLYILTTFLWGI